MRAALLQLPERGPCNLHHQVLFFIVWVWIGAFVFRNLFIGVMGTCVADSVHSQASPYGDLICISAQHSAKI